MHGRSLPSHDEHLVSTSNMNTVRVLDQCTLEVDCGVQIGGLNRVLNQHNCRLPVLHSGGHGGPSMAGYFLAGGIGEDSSMFGGFWSNVDEIFGLIYYQINRWYSQSDPEFWKISGSGEWSVTRLFRKASCSVSDISTVNGSKYAETF